MSFTLTPTWQDGVFFLRGRSIGGAGVLDHRGRRPSARRAITTTQARWCSKPASFSSVLGAQRGLARFLRDFEPAPGAAATFGMVRR